MIRRGLVIAATLIVPPLISTPTIAQQYYYVPSYQPMMFSQSPMQYDMPAMDTYGTFPESSANVVSKPAVPRARRTATNALPAWPVVQNSAVAETGNAVEEKQSESTSLSKAPTTAAGDEESIPLPQIPLEVAQSARLASAPCNSGCGSAQMHSVMFQDAGAEPATAINIPDCSQGAIHILNYPGILTAPDCCPDCTTGNCDKDIKRYPTKEAAIADGCDPECVICVKEPFICQKTAYEKAEVVFFRCYEKTTPFCDARCEDQRCIKVQGQRTVKKLDPCTVTISIPVKKTCIDYRTVWICIRCCEKQPYSES